MSRMEPGFSDSWNPLRLKVAGSADVATDGVPQEEAAGSALVRSLF